MNFKSSVNALYFYEAVQDQMHGAFKSSRPQVILLTDFFVKKIYDSLLEEAKKVSGKEVYEPHKYRFREIFLTELEEFFSSQEFLDLVREITRVKVKKVDLSLSKFGKGNYTLLHDDVMAKKRLLFFYTLCDKWQSAWGGSTIFTFGDERSPIVFESKGNSLVIMLVPDGMREFVKYVKHFAGESEMFKVEGVLI